MGECEHQVCRREGKIRWGMVCWGTSLMRSLGSRSQGELEVARGRRTTTKGRLWSRVPLGCAGVGVVVTLGEGWELWIVSELEGG